MREYTNMWDHSKKSILCYLKYEQEFDLNRIARLNNSLGNNVVWKVTSSQCLTRTQNAMFLKACLIMLENGIYEYHDNNKTKLEARTYCTRNIKTSILDRGALRDYEIILETISLY